MASFRRTGQTSIIGFYREETPTFTLRCRHPLHPERERVILVFFGRGVVGLYIDILRQEIWKGG
jgi:hypothetical protein